MRPLTLDGQTKAPIAARPRLMVAPPSWGQDERRSRTSGDAALVAPACAATAVSIPLVAPPMAAQARNRATSAAAGAAAIIGPRVVIRVKLLGSPCALGRGTIAGRSRGHFELKRMQKVGKACPAATAGAEAGTPWTSNTQSRRCSVDQDSLMRWRNLELRAALPCLPANCLLADGCAQRGHHGPVRGPEICL